MGRNYKDEYEKFQDSPSQLKKRAALNRANHKRGTYGNNDGLDVSHTKDGIRLEKSSINKGRKEKSRMNGSKRKQTGGYLKGPSHKNGGIAAVVGGQEPVELEGGEYIIKKSSVDKLGKKTLEEINKKGRIPTMKQGGKVDKNKKVKDNYGVLPDEVMKNIGKNKMAGKKVYNPHTGKDISKMSDYLEFWDEQNKVKKSMMKDKKYIPEKAGGGKIKNYKNGGNTDKFLEAGEDTIKDAWGKASESMKKVYGNDYNAFLSAVQTKQKNIKGYKGEKKTTKGATTKMPIKKKLTKEQKAAGFTYGGKKTQTNDKSKTKFLEGQKDLTKEFGDDNKKKVDSPVKGKKTTPEGYKVPKKSMVLKDKPKKKYDFSKPGVREARRKERRRAEVKGRLKKAKPIKKIEARKDKSGSITKTSDLMKKVKGRDQITFKKTQPAVAYEKKMKKEGKYGKKSTLRNLTQRMKNKLSKLKFQAGGPVQKPMGSNQVNPSAPYNPTSNIPARPPFRQGMRMMGHGGAASVSNDKATAGDIHTTYTHSGYKAGE